MSRLFPLSFLAILLAFTACTTTPVTGKKVFILTSQAQEAELGAQAYQQLLAKSTLSDNATWNSAVERVGSQIAQAAAEPDYQWEFKVIQSDQINAFCLPGGKIAVYTGLFKLAKNDAELAAVLGHEVAHATARHFGQRITLLFGTEIGFDALKMIIGGTDSPKKQLLFQALGLGATIGEVLPFSRAQESEADYIGLIYMAKAGYDPHAALTLWQSFAEQTGNPPEWLSDHPSPEHRIEDLKKHLPQAMGDYDKSARRGLGQSI